ncbi:hypothetical protein [Alcanivorax sp.]|uniref:hypothetical protein n=1 Tax=Alcanivorax sp. TaxID=1872427 RepID=UPI002B26BFAE|nr:hypothetical protein [Alcanivorax sp.]
MANQPIDQKITKSLSSIDEAKMDHPEWLIDRLDHIASTNAPESLCNIYRQLKSQAMHYSIFNIGRQLNSLSETEKKSLLFDLTAILKAWRNLKSLESRKKVQVNIQISHDAHKALKALAASNRISQGGVVEELLLGKRSWKKKKGSFPRNNPIILDREN